MGYQNVKIYLKDGTVIRDTVSNSEYLTNGGDYDLEDIKDIIVVSK